MSDLIRREDAIEAVWEALRTPLPCYGNDLLQDSMILAKTIVNNIPSVEPERTAKVSNQIFNNSNSYTIGAWIGTCECGELVSYSSKYCHMCGAKLEWNHE